MNHATPPFPPANPGPVPPGPPMLGHPGVGATPPSGADLREYLYLLRKRKLLFAQVFVLVLALGIGVTVVSKPVYQTRAKLLVPSGASSVSLIDSNNPIATMLAAAQPDSVATQLQVLQSAPFLSDAMREAKIQPRAGIVPPVVSVETLADANIIQINVEGGDPGEIARLANTILDMHLERTDLLQTTGLKETIEFVEKARTQAQKDLDTAQARLLSFRKTHRVVELTNEQEARTREYGQLEARVHELESTVSATKAQIADLKAKLEKEPMDLVTQGTKENPQRAELEAKLNRLKGQRAELLQDYLPGSEKIKEIDERIAGMTQQVQAEPETLPVRTHKPNPRHEGLAAKLAELEIALPGTVTEYEGTLARFQTQKRQVEDLGPWEVELARLTQDRDRAQASLNTLSDRLQDLEVRKSARLKNGREIERAAVPASPVRPRKTTNVALSFILALCLAAGAVFLQVFLDDRVNSPDDVERFARLPTLGHVPFIGPDQAPLVSALPAKSHVAEAYRSLRSAVMFAGIDAPIHRLQVTSASKGEGKSVTSVNLATAMAMDGKRVILVDADLRRPSIHRLLELPSSPGLTEVLAGVKPLEEAIQNTGVPNLRVVCAGPVPPNPAELLGSETFGQVIEQLEELADIVIFDTPPCIPVTDPVIVAARMDGVLLVLHLGQTRKASMKQALELLGRSRARVIGTVFNRVRPDAGGYYYYYNQYYYYHGDGYYADAATRGERHRNGRKRLRAGEARAVASAAETDDEA